MRATYKITDETKIVNGVTLHRIMALPGNRFAAPGTLGGWIEREENLEDGAWVGGDACAYEQAHLDSGAHIFESAQAYGNCSIIEGATVFGEAEVFDNAIVAGRTHIRGTSKVYGNAKVVGECLLNDFTRIHGDAVVCGPTCERGFPEPIVFSDDTEINGGYWDKAPYFKAGSTWNVNVTSPTSFRIGCMNYPFSRWHKSWKAIARLGKKELEKRLGESTEITDELIAEYLQYFNGACDATGNQKYKTDLATLLPDRRN